MAHNAMIAIDKFAAADKEHTSESRVLDHATNLFKLGRSLSEQIHESIDQYLVRKPTKVDQITNF